MDDTIENELAKYIKRNLEWDALPTKAKLRCSNSRQVWQKMVVNYSVKHQLSWMGTLVGRLVHDEKRYYTEVARVSKQNLLIYPYHLQEEFVRLLKITPFQYYYSMMTEVMQRELSYDTIPNFTAADGRRLLGIGRNQFIDAMNKTRSKTFLGRKRYSPKDLLTTQPVDPVFIDYWWTVRLSTTNEREMDMSQFSPQERATIELLQRNDTGVQAGRLPRLFLEQMFKKGQVWLDVPIEETDRISIPPLDQFVMNRLRGDFFERLLYTIFFTITESTTVLELSSLIQNDLPSVQKAVSLYCRLGFAHKLTVPRFQLAPGWDESLMPKADIPHTLPVSGGAKIGLVYDEELTAFLMMGNLGAGLKAHAVTMFERGKVSPLGIATFMTELDKIPDDVPQEGEVIRYYLSALALRSTLRTLSASGSVAMLRSQSANDLPELLRKRVLAQQYDVLISFCPVSPNAAPVLCQDPPHHFGCPLPVFSTPWWKIFIYQAIQSGPTSLLFPRGLRVRRLPDVLRRASNIMLTTWQNQSSQVSPAALLPLLNESLLAGPVLVQVVGQFSKASATFCPDSASVQRASESGRTATSHRTQQRQPTMLKDTFDATGSAVSTSLLDFDYQPAATASADSSMLLLDFDPSSSSSSSTTTSSSSATVAPHSSLASGSASSSRSSLPPTSESVGLMNFSNFPTPSNPEQPPADAIEPNDDFGKAFEDEQPADAFTLLMSEYTGIHHVGEKLMVDELQSRESSIGRTLQGTPIMDKIIQRLRLDASIGYAQFIQDPNDSHSFVLFDIQFGLPLYDRQLNEQLIEALVPDRALSSANLQRHSEQMQALSDEITSFVTSPYPDCIYVFHSGALHRIPPSAL